MNVPFLDLKAQYAGIKGEVNAAIQDVLDSSAFAGGPFVEKFEREWAAYCGVKHAVGVGNGTDALWLALLALGVGPEDEVITVPNTFIATAEAIVQCGATPVYVDVDEDFCTMNPDLIEAAITPRTKAIVPVHLFGQMADMDRISGVARAHGLPVLEDACQAHGASYKGRKAGSTGDAAAFSFYPGKNLGAYGEAGAITTDSDEIAGFARMFRDHGQSRKYFHDIVGWNARMDGIQAAVLSVKLTHLDEWNDKRIRNAALYERELSDDPSVVIPKVRERCRHVFHVYAIRVNDRSTVMARMQGAGIGVGIHYPVPVHRQKAFPGLSGRCYPVSEAYASGMISLPMFPELGESQIAHVVSALRDPSRQPQKALIG